MSDAEPDPHATPALSLADRRMSIWLSLLVFATTAWFWGGGGWNQNAAFDLTRAIVERHTLSIDAYAGNTGDVSYANGHVYANKAPALSFIAAVPYAVLYHLEGGGAASSNPVLLTFNAYASSLFSVALLGALLPAALYRFGRRRGVAPLWCAVVALTISLATEIFPYSTLLMAAVPSASLLFVSYVLIDILRTKRFFLAGVLASTAGTMNFLCLPLALLLVLPLLLLPGTLELRARLRLVLLYAAGMSIPISLLAAYQFAAFGSPFTTPIATMDQRFVTPGALFGIFKLPALGALYGVTLSPYRGLFWFAPVLLCGVAAVAWRAFRKVLEAGARTRRIDSVITVGLFLFLVLLNASFNGWDGGFGIGSRYLVPAIPFLGIGLLYLEARGRKIAIVLAVLSFVVNFTATAVDPQPSGTIPRPLTQYIAPLFLRGEFPASVPITPPWSAKSFTGHVGVNRVAMDEPRPFFRHAAGSAASDWASFNLGEASFGTGSSASVVPIALLMIAGTAVILRRAAKLGRAP